MDLGPVFGRTASRLLRRTPQAHKVGTEHPELLRSPGSHALGQNFDLLARALAAGLSRRQAFVQLGGFIVADLIGCSVRVAPPAAQAAVCPAELAQCYVTAQQDYGNCLNDCPAKSSACRARCAAELGNEKRDCDANYACSSGMICCGGSCTDPADPNNCGSCGNICYPSPGGSMCCRGVCHYCPEGPPGLVIRVCTDQISQCDCNCAALGGNNGLQNCQCNGVCKNLADDPQNCGQCFRSETPPGGVGGEWKCCNGTPTPIVDDPIHCGDCVTVCSGKIPRCCSFHCVDAASDPQNCGECGKPCPPSGTCVNGVCECPPEPWKKCSGICVDTSISQLNCGSCGNACLPGETCCSSACACNCTTGEKCSPIETCCSGKCANTQTDVANCGGCGQECWVAIGHGELTHGVCVGRQCHCPGNLIPVPGAFFDSAQVCCAPSTPNWCPRSAICTNISNDPNNCGECDHICPAGQVCVSGRCECPVTEQQCGTTTNGDPICCAPDEECCKDRCVNTQTDPANCGACGVNCGSGNCVDRVCQCPPGTGCGDRGCCTDPTLPVCLPASYYPGGFVCGRAGCVLACPPPPGYPYPTGYCCGPGLICCSDGCCPP